MGSVCYQSCQFQDPTKRICVYNDDGSLKGCRADYISTGEYCDESDGASDRPFDDYTDAEGCYHDSGLNRYCATPAGDCPNEVVVDGVRYCRMPGEDDGDPDDPTDPGGPDDPEDPDDPEEPEEPEEPEVYCDENGGWNGSSYCNAGDDGHWGPGCGWHCGGDGGGGNDGDGDGDNGGDNGGGDNGGGNGGGGDSGGDGDGNGDGDGDQGDGDGDGGSDGIGSGTCNVDGQEAPECTDDQDGVQCAIVLHTWYLNCRDKLWKEDVAGTDEYLAGDSLLTDSEKNTVREQEIDISDRLSDLDDSGAGLGGSASCPSDLKVDLGRFGTLTIPMTFLCKLATTINPLVQALGWLVAALIVLERFSDN
ncbi:hypothetical protein A3Q32_12375 [Alcanivorax sp. KX64203]|nr:hypothetical protein A3Q32_12375 [Alcanivorax sp. KX64203]